MGPVTYTTSVTYNKTAMSTESAMFVEPVADGDVHKTCGQE